jgi:hypothetical protein
MNQQESTRAVIDSRFSTGQSIKEIMNLAKIIKGGGGEGGLASQKFKNILIELDMKR